MEPAQTAEQTIEHQLAHARLGGFTIDEVGSDNGVSGLSSVRGLFKCHARRVMITNEHRENPARFWEEHRP
jgi:hypothetical protein